MGSGLGKKEKVGQQEKTCSDETLVVVKSSCEAGMGSITGDLLRLPLLLL